VEHVKAMPDAVRIRLSREDVAKIHEAGSFEPLFPIPFLYNFRGDQSYHLGLTAADVQQVSSAVRIGAPPKQAPY
jgi:hypothetical protein